MKSDAVIRWVEYQNKIRTFYTKQAALTTAANWTAIVMLFGFFVTSIGSGFWGKECRPMISREETLALVTIILVGGVVWFFLAYSSFEQTTDAEILIMPASKSETMHSNAAREAFAEVKDSPGHDLIRNVGT